ncbi:uncharacterized protein [Triticum aestivum]|uniref:uncharacterized protein n=1 Tax=Triticum aestivum TaxID=4565 RepID=UPI0008434148|nr:uncharacterized protein LOC123132037 [Triticum aestivum]XP_044407716.1 uncharacterized protein LOC123132037 [Triticum aestivum]XP_044407717.1 uncharacterized protein LOC123132037 [Triticum aestivum]
MWCPTSTLYYLVCHINTFFLAHLLDRCQCATLTPHTTLLPQTNICRSLSTMDIDQIDFSSSLDNNILSEIFIRLGCTRSLVRSSVVSPRWFEICTSQQFIMEYARRNAPAVLGFIAAFERLFELHVRLVDVVASPPDPGQAALLARVDVATFAMENILASEAGELLVLVRGLDGGFFSVCPNPPFSRSFLAPRMPRVPLFQHQHTPNLYGQFGVILIDSRPNFSFFVKQAAGPFVRSYSGLSFSSVADLYVHVCILKNNEWSRFVSPPLRTPPGNDGPLFHWDPYYLLVGSNLYMMYVVGFVVCFNIDTFVFSTVQFPVSVTSCFDYHISRSSSGIISFVHSDNLSLRTWRLSSREHEETAWFPMSEINLASSFGSRCQHPMWRQLFLGVDLDDGIHSMQISNSSGNVHEVQYLDEDGALRSIVSLTEHWPPVVNMPNHDAP